MHGITVTQSKGNIYISQGTVTVVFPIGSAPEMSKAIDRATWGICHIPSCHKSVAMPMGKLCLLHGQRLANHIDHVPTVEVASSACASSKKNLARAQEAARRRWLADHNVSID